MKNSQFIGKIYFASIFLAITFAFAANVKAVCTIGSNLILNGDAEADTALAGSGLDHDLSSWNPEAGSFTAVRYTTGGGFPTNSDPGPASRGNFFFAGGPQNGVTSSGTQIIDVTDCSARIDASRQIYDVSGFFGGFASQPDTATFTLNFKTEDNFDIGTVSIGTVTAGDRGNTTGMVSRAANGLIPPGTRTIEVVLSMPPSSGYNDGYADNLSLILSIPAGTWDGGGATNNWSEAANWTGDILPPDSMTVVFEEVSTKNVVFDIPLTRTGTTAISAGYTGTLSMGSTNLTFNSFTQNDGIISIGSGNLNFNGVTNLNGGTFNAGTGTITINGSFFFSNGTFNGGSGNLICNSVMNLGTGTFNAPSGNLIYNGLDAFQIQPLAVFNPNGGTFTLNSSGISLSPATVNFHNFTTSTSGFFIGSDKTIIVSGTLNLFNGTTVGNNTFQASGNVNIGSGYSGGSDAFQFTGAGIQTFTNSGGANPGGIWTLNKTGGTVNLASNLDLSNGTGNLVLTNGTITTNSNIVIAGTRDITRTNGFINGNLRRTFTAIGSKTFDVGTINGYAPVTINATAGTFGTSTTFTVGGNDGTLNGANPDNSLTRNWTLNPSTGGITQANIRFDYQQSDVPVTANEASFAFLRRNGLSTIGFTPTTIDTTNNFFTLNEVTVFSDWSLGILNTTAASANIGGRVLDDAGRGISRARLTLIDFNGNTRSAMTNPFGFYRFDAVEVGETYIISVAHKSYQFANPTQAVFVLGNLSDIDFTAINQAAANSSLEIGGQVKNAKGAGLANVEIEISGGSLKKPLTVKTDEQGFYSFEDLAFGETYFLKAKSKIYSFSEPLRVITLTENLKDGDFVADSK